MIGPGRWRRVAVVAGLALIVVGVLLSAGWGPCSRPTSCALDADRWNLVAIVAGVILLALAAPHPLGTPRELPQPGERRDRDVR